MIQDIYPKKLHNEFRNDQPQADDRIAVFDSGDRLLVRNGDTDGRNMFPLMQELPHLSETVYLFSVDEQKYFLARSTEVLPEGFTYKGLRELRRDFTRTDAQIYAAYTAYHLHIWYKSAQYCGVCGTKTVHDDTERACVCPACRTKIYPRINPAVIIGVKNGERILLTRYNRGYAHNALVAGFCEIGETVEETVAREVMEEAGLHVKNIRYYKSQPWGIAQDILMGFWCDVDGDDTITVDRSELKSAVWTARQDIILQPDNYSLTNEMMRVFRDGGENA